MDRSELLERYEATGDERWFHAALPLFERALAEEPDAGVLRDYGYLLQGYARATLRRAVELYERGIALDPDDDKLHVQLISAKVELLDGRDAVARYERAAAAAPDDLRAWRFLALACLHTGPNARAEAAIAAGLALAPDDPVLLAHRGELRAATGDPDGALEDWRRALALEPEDIGPLYGAAFLLEHEGRLDEAVAAWTAIVDWNEARGHALQAEWPRRELERLRRGA